MQSLEDRRVMHLSYINMEKGDDLGHQQLHKNGLNEQNEILRLPNIHSLVNNSHMDNNHLQKEFFSLKIRNCALFKAVPLPHIGKKMPPHLSDTASGAASSKESLGLLFSPEKGTFEKLFKHFEGAAVIGWLQRAHNFIGDMGTWSYCGDNFVRFAHFWISELQYNQKQQLLELEMGVIEDEVRLAFEGSDSKEFQPSDLNSILAAVLSEYPVGLVNNQNPYVFLDYLNLMSSADTSGYKKMLSSIQYTTKNPQIAQWLLAIRAFALANLWHAIVKFYKALVKTQLSSEQPIKSSVSATRKQSSEVVKERCSFSVGILSATLINFIGICARAPLKSIDVVLQNSLVNCISRFPYIYTVGH
ncbi:salivary gland specific protein SAGSIN1 isoform X2 [Rhineura floridana]|uniref:salivary gland specific protein SAGSIN1 isoform X2 n=1 Tax=Rhineura floridana TaxID=261503 RepID=UPI002AC7F4F0|nr:salivary gland specific protein SAGSIN1 isoform X2 [Rhineura floridana]